METYCVTDRLMLVRVCVCGRSVCVFGEEVQPVLEIVLTVTGHLHPLTLATCTATHTHEYNTNSQLASYISHNSFEQQTYMDCLSLN